MRRKQADCRFFQHQFLSAYASARIYKTSPAAWLLLSYYPDNTGNDAGRRSATKPRIPDGGGVFLFFEVAHGKFRQKADRDR
jgi:hypothetical protein